MKPRKQKKVCDKSYSLNNTSGFYIEKLPELIKKEKMKVTEIER